MATDPRDEIVDHLTSLRAFARSLTRSTAAADDLVQDTVVKAWSNIDKFQPGTNMRAWLFTILRNTFYSSHRKQKREVEDVDGDMAERLSEKPAHDGRLALKDFAVAFKQLPAEQRESLLLVGASGFSYEEAADMCDCAVGTIKSRVNRARKRLSEMLDLDENDKLELTDAATVAVVSGPAAA
ncbi:RNA polymerase sigma factor [Gymnodinialimonas ceratoperidinii]|uniref:RNA polymerase sigma factor n=1 Tax=Gymnodinialimonas ceratoperidinii TaxID=2856823 RepID=A0A8F6TWB1_9RHOB|nr:RNA polymerase sigma factor [Gymnodinialimonas ceratoperidinii]QXT39104.1 RNA polymerase sigma factor [Gymnodinialimonas ceratoperidinii]